MSRARIFAGALLFAYAGVIFYWSNQPSIPIPMRFPHQDKLLHFSAYFILGALAANAFDGLPGRRRFWVALAFASAYGVSDEFHQSFVPGRDVDFFDWLADTVGGAAGAFTYLRARRLV